MHKREIVKLNARVMQEGVALIPLSLYFKDSRVKVETCLCKGQKLYDKRNDDAKREAARDIERNFEGETLMSNPVVTIEMENGDIIKAEGFIPRSHQYGQQLHLAGKE